MSYAHDNNTRLVLDLTCHLIGYYTNKALISVTKVTKFLLFDRLIGLIYKDVYYSLKKSHMNLNLLY